MYTSAETPARHRESSGEAGGLVRLVEILNFHTNRCEIPRSGAHRKNCSFPNWKLNLKMDAHLKYKSHSIFLMSSGKYK
jgi:hypothetical protein